MKRHFQFISMKIRYLTIENENHEAHVFIVNVNGILFCTYSSALSILFFFPNISNDLHSFFIHFPFEELYHITMHMLEFHLRSNCLVAFDFIQSSFVCARAQSVLKIITMSMFVRFFNIQRTFIKLCTLFACKAGIHFCFCCCHWCEC